MNGLFSAMNVSASGLQAERLRMEVTANNIANANTSMTQTGDPYRRKTVVFSSRMDSSQSPSISGMGGVQVVGIEADDSEFPLVFNENHPHAREDGMVRMPNVHVPNEMIDLITASRSYEANLKAITLFKEMVEQSLTLLQGGRS